ncbi:hypothetical protein C9374_008294 [Naegleria lovaniensis]|uniref:DNA-directed RNA polymerase RBP11-like dimerisation domain-containing protein n=1 Tax=Naegleria lovaniensis TaxID=51637 RepID=A0AA88KGH7_NAELO|nr:uncharacterized protein C9374_008294 [Naegleria lovaniensis]KAG2378655.1 hypothetical protein C9374_008294 [Naegleria lovaniensis]
MNKPETYELFDLEGEIKVKAEKIEKMPNAANFIVNKEDHTLGNIIRMRLHEDRRVLFAGYKIPHPLEHHIEIKIQTTEDSEPREALMESIASLIRSYNQMKRDFLQSVKEINPDYMPYDLPVDHHGDEDDGVED